MSIRFLHILSIACLLSMYLTILQPSSGDHKRTTDENQSIFASASCNEGERIQGAHWYTVHKASAYTRSNMLNDMGDYHSGWYQAEVFVNGLTDLKTNYFSGKINKKAYKEILYALSPGEVDGSGTAQGYIYGVGCSDSAYDSSNFDELL